MPKKIVNLYSFLSYLFLIFILCICKIIIVLIFIFIIITNLKENPSLFTIFLYSRIYNVGIKLNLKTMNNSLFNIVFFISNPYIFATKIFFLDI